MSSDRTFSVIGDQIFDVPAKLGFKAGSVTVQFKDRNRQSVHHYQSEVPSAAGFVNSILVTYDNEQLVVSDIQRGIGETEHSVGKTSIYELSDVHAVHTDRMEKLS